MKKITQKILSGSGFLLVSLLVTNFLNFVFNAFLGRILTFEEFGLLSIMSTLWYIATLFLNSLASTVNHKSAYLTGKSGKNSSVAFYVSTLKRSLIVAAGISLVWLAISPFLSAFFDVDNTFVLVYFTPVIVLGTLLAVGRGFLQGNFYFYAVGILTLADPIGKLIASLFFVGIKQLYWIYLSIPFALFISCLLVMFYVRGALNASKKIKETSDILQFPKKFYTVTTLSSFATNAFFTFDIVFVRHFLTPTAAGEYAFLSLAGKMIYFFGSLCSIFIFSFVARDMGAKKNTYKTFYKILLANSVLTTIAYIALGPLGSSILPYLLGAKTHAILSYLPNYALAISLFVLTNTLLTYHLARKQYYFCYVSILMTALLCLGITIFHANVAAVVHVILTISTINFFVIGLLHLLQRNGKFVLRNFVDLLDLFAPIEQTSKKIGKRILIFNWRDTKHKFAGGAEIYLHELAKRWVKQGYQVTLFCGNDGKSKRHEMIDGVAIIRRGGFYFVYVWAFLYYMLRFRGTYDVIVDGENGIPFFTPLYAKEKVYLLIHHIHQEVFRTSLHPVLSAIASSLELHIMPFVYKHVDMITVSPSSKSEITQTLSFDSQPTIVYNGVDTKYFVPGKKNPHPTILYLGRLKKYKSVHILVQTAKQIVQKIPSVEVIIAGEGEEGEKLKKLTKKLGLENSVRFLGRVTEEEKKLLYQKAWLFINPSLMEGWGITTIEANACGTPVVASDVPGLRDSVQNNRTGFLIPYGKVDIFAEKILLLVNNQKMRKAMEKETIVWAKKFDWEQSADTCLRLIMEGQKEEIVATKPAGVLAISE